MLKTYLKRLWKNEDGGLFIYFALAIIPILGFIGLSVDMSRAYHARAMIVNAADAAAMAAAKVPTDQAQAEAERVFNAYLDGTSVAGQAQVDSVTINEDMGFVQVQASTDVVMSFIKVFGYETLGVKSKSRVLIAGGSVEVALVLDNTGSMNNWISGKRRIDHLKEATELLIETLIPTDDAPEDLWISIIPYITQVNTGPKTHWLKSTGQTMVNSTNFFPAGWGQWQGCLEARLNDDLHKSDTPPTDENTRFMPYWWPSTEFQNYPYPSGSVEPWGNWVQGDNDWTPSFLTSWTSTNPRNPNAGCPVEVLPLTNVRDDLLAKNQEMFPIGRGGTFIFSGLKVGFWNLSPKWRDLWHGSNPDELPKDYQDSKKVIVLMTDGYNQWIGGNAPRWYYGDNHYTSYGRWYGSAHSALNQNIVQPSTMNDYTLEICSEVKNSGILLYTITFGVANQGSRDLMEACATNPSYYYDAQSAAELSDAFAEIATKIQEMRYSWPDAEYSE